MGKYTYAIKNLKIKPWLKWWLERKSEKPIDYNKTFFAGYSLQNSTTGINLFDYKNYTYDKTIMANYRFIEIKNVQPNTTYTIYNYDDTLEGFSNVYLANNTTYADIIWSTKLNNKESREVTISNEGKLYLCTYVDSWNESKWNTFIKNFENAMFVQGTDITAPYEPYTGGIPAPNPDYPETIYNIDGEDVIFEIGSHRVTFPLNGNILFKDTELTPNGIKNYRKQVNLSNLSWNTVSTNKYRTPKFEDMKFPTSHEVPNLLAEKYIPVSDTQTLANGEIALVQSNNYIYVVDETGTPTGILEYELAEPEIIPYTESQLEAYKNLCKYFPDNTNLNEYIVTNV